MIFVTEESYGVAVGSSRQYASTTRVHTNPVLVIVTPVRRLDERAARISGNFLQSLVCPLY